MLILTNAATCTERTRINYTQDQYFQGEWKQLPSGSKYVYESRIEFGFYGGQKLE